MLPSSTMEHACISNLSSGNYAVAQKMLVISQIDIRIQHECGKRVPKLAEAEKRTKIVGAETECAIMQAGYGFTVKAQFSPRIDSATFS